MFARRISQSFRVARISASFYPSLRYTARPLLSSAVLYPGPYSVSHDIPPVSTFTTSDRNEPAVSPKTLQAVPERAEDLTPPLTTIHDFEEALDHAFSQKHYPAVEAVVDKLVDLYRSEPALSFSIFLSLLQREDAKRLSDTLILDILQLLRSSPYEAKSLPPQILVQTLQHRRHNNAIESVLLDILKLQVGNIEAPDGPDYVQYEPPAAVKQAFLILPSLIAKQPQVALDIFNSLLEKGFIPPESVEDPDLLKSDDISLIMFTGLAKASLHWDLPDLIPEVMGHFRKAKCAHHPLVPNFLTALSSLLLDKIAVSNASATFEACLAIIRAHRVPDNIIRRFYKNAKEYGCGSEAAELYALTRSYLADSRNPYPAPRMMALGWLMQHLFDSGQQSLCQTLAREVLDCRLPIPSCYCPSFIRIAVLSSKNHDLGVARSLWERYAKPTRAELEEMLSDATQSSLAPTTPHSFQAMIRVKKAVQSDGALALAMVEGLSHAIRAKKIQADRESDNAKRESLIKDVRRTKVFMHKVANDFEVTWKHFNGTPTQQLSYRIRILLIVGRYKDAIAHFRRLIRWSGEAGAADEIRSCWEVMAAQDAEMAAVLVEELDKLGLHVDSKTCLGLLVQAIKQDEWRVAEFMKATLLRRGVDLGGLKLPDISEQRDPPVTFDDAQVAG
ncbi:hypothetical protein NMY22_g381 [Coprinellus aureogranulatus]|nr:hypothetical protein NMY22_g381 [Coprinellus aureogranulatus]